MPFTPPDPGIPQPMVEKIRNATYDYDVGGVRISDGTILSPMLAASGVPQVVTWELASQEERGSCPVFRLDHEAFEVLSKGAWKDGFVDLNGRLYKLVATETEIGLFIAKIEAVQ